MTKSRNTIAWLLFRFFQDLALIYPVYLILFQRSGLDYTELAWLLAIWAAAVVLLELPSGILADLWSRKGILCIGLCLKAAGFMVWLLWQNFSGFALGFILWGFQEALCSGTSDALLYDALKAYGLEQEFERVLGLGGLFSRLAIIAALLLGAWVFSWSPALTLLASAVAMLLSALASLFLVEHRPLPAGRSSADRLSAQAADKTGLRQTCKEMVAAISISCRQPGMLVFILFYTGTGVLYGVLDEYDFMYAGLQGVPLAWIGVWGAGRFLLEGAGSALAPFLSGRFGLAKPRRLAFWVMLAGFALILGTVWQQRWLVPAYFIFYGMMAVAEVLGQGILQRRIDSMGRATVTSFVSLVYTAASIGLGLLLGFLADRLGLSAMFSLGGLAVLAGALMYALHRQAPIHPAGPSQPDGSD